MNEINARMRWDDTQITWINKNTQTSWHSRRTLSIFCGEVNRNVNSYGCVHTLRCQRHNVRYRTNQMLRSLVQYPHNLGFFSENWIELIRGYSNHLLISIERKTESATKRERFHCTPVHSICRWKVFVFPHLTCRAASVIASRKCVSLFYFCAWKTKIPIASEDHWIGASKLQVNLCNWSPHEKEINRNE